MKKLNENRICFRTAAAAVTPVLLALSAFAAESDFDGVVSPIVSLLNSLLGPLLAIVGAVGALYCVILGVKFAKAEEPQEREKAKSHLKNAAIGFVLIFVLILALKLLTPVMMKWVNTQAVANNQSAVFSD